MILAKKIGPQIGKSRDQKIDMGMVGEVQAINPQIIQVLDEGRFIPVISPVGVNSQGETFNVNADLVAGQIASALKAEKMILLTDVTGVLDQNQALIPTLSQDQANELMSNDIVKGGMKPKLSCCINALRNGVKKAHIINGQINHALLLEIFTDTGVGTVIL